MGRSAGVLPGARGVGFQHTREHRQLDEARGVVGGREAGRARRGRARRHHLRTPDERVQAGGGRCLRGGILAEEDDTHGQLGAHAFEREQQAQHHCRRRRVALDRAHRGRRRGEDDDGRSGRSAQAHSGLHAGSCARAERRRQAAWQRAVARPLVAASGELAAATEGVYVVCADRARVSTADGACGGLVVWRFGEPRKPTPGTHGAEGPPELAVKCRVPEGLHRCGRVGRREAVCARPGAASLSITSEVQCARVGPAPELSLPVRAATELPLQPEAAAATRIQSCRCAYMYLLCITTAVLATQPELPVSLT